MSTQVRHALVDSGLLFFQSSSQRDDLLNLDVTQTGLIAVLQYVVLEKKHPVELTAVCSDHHNDRALGEHCHANGYCADLWPLNSATEGAYVDATSEAFAQFLRDVAAAPCLYQIGLAGGADTETNHAAAGETCFTDGGADHVHIGARNP